MRASPRLAGAAIALALLLASPREITGAEGARLSVALDPPHLLVGDRVTATLSLPLSALPPDAAPVFPDWSDGWGKAEVLAASAVTTEGEGAARAAVQHLTLTAFEPGRVALPPKPVRVGDSIVLETPADLSLEVRSVIDVADQELKPAPPAPPRRMPVPRSAWIALAAGVALAAVAALLAWRRKMADDPLSAPQLSPLAELERALALLGEVPSADAFRGLSTALRRYLGRSFGFHALESTTSEIHKVLSERGLVRELVQRSVQTLRLSDQVKFARRAASHEEAAGRLGETREIASAIETALHPEPVAKSASAAPGAMR